MNLRICNTHDEWVFGFRECVEIVTEQGGKRKASLFLWLSHSNAAMWQWQRAMYLENPFVMGIVSSKAD
jgi:hypothetical protein